MSAGAKQKFIKNAKSQFKDEATGVAGEKTTKGSKASRHGTSNGVSLKSGYRNRTCVYPKPSPGYSIHGT